MALVQPKKPVGGAFGIFLAEKRPEFSKACAGQNGSQVSKMAGASWKSFRESDKAPYQKKYEAVKATYDKDVAAFEANGGVMEKGLMAMRSEKRKEKEGGSKKVKDANAPKKPVGGAYGVFMAENRDKIFKDLPAGSNKTTDVGKAAGPLFKALSDGAKKLYQEAYEKKAAEYAKALEAYNKSKPADAEPAEDDEEEEEEEQEAKPAPKKRAVKAEAKAPPKKKAKKA